MIVNGYPKDPVNEVVDEISKQGGKALGFVVDISIEKMPGNPLILLRMYGKLNILVNMLHRHGFFIFAA